MSDIIKIGISQGDTNGIAYEIIIKMFEDTRIYESGASVVYGSSKILAYHRKTLEMPSLNVNNISNIEEIVSNRFNIFNVAIEDVIVEFGKSTNNSIKAANAALSKGFEDLKTGTIDVLLAAPSTIDLIPWIESKTTPKENCLKILVKDKFRIALATDKIALSEVSTLLTEDLLMEKVQILHSCLVHDFMISSPRIAILSLNPQTGTKEKIKDEEETILSVIKKSLDADIICLGPYPADDFFGTDEFTKFDAILAMYYDQGAVAFQSITAGEGAVFIAGLPYIITAANQGVSYDKAGKNESSPDSLRNAFYLAIEIHRNRIIDKEINANPLRKLYFERGSDNEKLDLTKDDD
jgi:4-hydroxythreonine-4-phosphate dehydrogenase